MTNTTRKPNKPRSKTAPARNSIAGQIRRFAKHHFTSLSAARRCLLAADRDWPTAYKLLLKEVRAGSARIDRAAIIRKLAR